MLRKRKAQTDVVQRDASFSIGDAALAEFLGLSSTSLAGVSVTPESALGLSAFYRGVRIIADTIAGLPLKTYKEKADGTRERVVSWLDAPHADLTPFEFVELLVVQLLLWEDFYAAHVYNGAGALVGLEPIHPASVTPKRSDNQWGKAFDVRMADGTLRPYTPADLLHVPGFSLDGLRGKSVVELARQSLGTALAGDQAAGRMFGNGLLLGGIVTPKDGVEVTEEQALQAKAGLKARATGVKNAGDIAFIPAGLDFRPWSMTAKDAEFMDGRQFGVEECARWLGVPKELLSASGATSWGSGIQELVKGLGRFTLAGHTNRIQQRLSRLLPKKQFCEFEYAGLEKSDPKDEIRLLIEQVNSGLLTKDEARAIRNLPPLPKPEDSE